MRAILITTLALLLLTSCGQKGPLYLPQDQQTDNAVNSNDKDTAPAQKAPTEDPTTK